jgi:hypothetical protein
MSAAHVEIETQQILRLREANFLSIHDRTPFGLGGPYIRHPKEMPLQTRVTNVAYQLHAV